MRHYKVLDVKTVDFTTFENFPGGAEFESEFKTFSEGRFTYKFYTEEDLATAEKRLTESNLEYSKFYGYETESDDEIKSHPAFFIIFSSEYNTLEMIDGKPILNAKKMKSKNFQKDTEEGILVVTEKAKKFLENNTVGITSKLLAGSSKPFFELTHIPELSFPILYCDNTTVKPAYNNEGKFSLFSDGRTTLEPGAILEIAYHGLAISRTFKVKDKIYPDVFTIFIGSGTFVNELMQQFDLKKEWISIRPFMLELPNS